MDAQSPIDREARRRGKGGLAVDGLLHTGSRYRRRLGHMPERETEFRLGITARWVIIMFTWPMKEGNAVFDIP